MDEVHKSRSLRIGSKNGCIPSRFSQRWTVVTAWSMNQINPDKAKATVSTRKDGRGDSKYPGWGSNPHDA